MSINLENPKTSAELEWDSQKMILLSTVPEQVYGSIFFAETTTARIIYLDILGN
jgi:hypothetical protein